MKTKYCGKKVVIKKPYLKHRDYDNYEIFMLAVLMLLHKLFFHAILISISLQQNLQQKTATSQARVFIPPRTTAKTLVAAGHANPQILGVIRIIASLST